MSSAALEIAPERARTDLLAASCPHCRMPLGSVLPPYPPGAMPCMHCRLLIAAGRAQLGDGVARANGAAAGILVARARRESGEVIDADVVVRAFALVAGELDCNLERLRMLDYEIASQRNPDLPCLADIIATFGGWKKACKAAAGRV